MRALLLTALMAIPASAASVPLFSQPTGTVPVMVTPPADKGHINPNRSAALAQCPPTAAQMAADRARKQGGGELFRKLTDLPPGQTFMAVYRLKDGCEDPMTMVEYRNGKRR